MCFYTLIVRSNRTDYRWSAGTKLSLHSLFHWVEMIPSISSPPRAPSHHRSSFSPCMCALSIKRSISFRWPQGATSTLAQIGIAQSFPLPPLPFLHTRLPIWLSDSPPSCTQWPWAKSRCLVACYMTCDIRLTQWHKRKAGSVVHPTMLVPWSAVYLVVC